MFLFEICSIVEKIEYELIYEFSLLKSKLIDGSDYDII